MDRQLFGEVIRHARKARELTLDKLASKTGLTKGYLSGIENGKVNPPTPEPVRRLAKQLELAEKELILFSFVVKAPRQIREIPEFVEFRDKVMSACRAKNMLPGKPGETG
jgi:transcriptional regulator with XRE-family HTH domain